MIAAGVQELHRRGQTILDDDFEEVVRDIFLAMTEASNEVPMSKKQKRELESALARTMASLDAAWDRMRARGNAS